MYVSYFKLIPEEIIIQGWNIVSVFEDFIIPVLNVYSGFYEYILAFTSICLLIFTQYISIIFNPRRTINYTNLIIKNISKLRI